MAHQVAHKQLYSGEKRHFHLRLLTFFLYPLRARGLMRNLRSSSIFLRESKVDGLAPVPCRTYRPVSGRVMRGLFARLTPVESRSKSAVAVTESTAKGNSRSLECIPGDSAGELR